MRRCFFAAFRIPTFEVILKTRRRPAPAIACLARGVLGHVPAQLSTPHGHERAAAAVQGVRPGEVRALAAQIAECHPARRDAGIGRGVFGFSACCHGGLNPRSAGRADKPRRSCTQTCGSGFPAATDRPTVHRGWKVAPTRIVLGLTPKTPRRLPPAAGCSPTPRR